MFVKQAVDTKAKATRQTLLLVQESDVYYMASHRPPKYQESKDFNNFEAKKNYFFATNSNSGNSGQSSSALGQFFMKNSCLNKRD